MNVIVGGFLVLAPLLASRLSNRRSQVIAVGVVTLATAAALGIFTQEADRRPARRPPGSDHPGDAVRAGQLGRIPARAVGPGAGRRHHQDGRFAGRRLEPQEAYDLLARSARTLSAANAAAVYRRQGEQMVTVAGRPRGSAGDADAAAEASFPAAFMTVTTWVSARSTEPEAPMLAARGLDSLLWLPLLDRTGDQLGTIVLAWKRDPRLSAQALEASRASPASAPGPSPAPSGCRPRPRSWSRSRRSCSPPRRPGWPASRSGSATSRPGPDRRRLLRRGRAGRARPGVHPGRRPRQGLEASSLAAVLKGAFRSLAGEGRPGASSTASTGWWPARAATRTS